MGCQLRELILEWHGTNAPSTYRRNNNKVPIGGIWATPGIKIMAGGYFDFDEVFFNTDDQTLGIDSTFVTAFGHNMPPIAKPGTRRLHCKNPWIIKNYPSIYENFAIKHKLLGRVKRLEKKASYLLKKDPIEEFEQLDKLRCQGTALAEKKCWKLRKGQVAYSSEIHVCTIKIRACNLLRKSLKV